MFTLLYLVHNYIQFISAEKPKEVFMAPTLETRTQYGHDATTGSFLTKWLILLFREKALTLIPVAMLFPTCDFPNCP